MHAKTEAYNASLESEEYIQGRLEYDLWTAAFFWPIPKGDAENMLAPTQQELLRLRKGDDLDAELVRCMQEIAEKQRFFHWEFEFPTIFDGNDPGFDVVLGNPPWEKINLKDEEYFAQSHPHIAQARTKAIRNKLIDKLKLSFPAEYQAYSEEQAFHDNLSNYFRNSQSYPLTGISRINLYSVFTETGLKIISPRGRMGMVIASGIATDDNNKALFEELVAHNRLISVFDFENRDGIFPAVHRMYKFCLFCAGGTQTNHPEANYAFYLARVEQLKYLDKLFILSYNDLKKINPNTRTCPTFKSVHDARVTKRIYSQVPAWCYYDTSETPIGVPKTPFNMSNDSGLFRTKIQLDASNKVIIHSDATILSDDIYLPLYESKLIHQFNHRYATFSDEESVKEASVFELQNPKYIVSGRHWLSRRILEGRFPERWFLAYRKITNAANARTSISAIIPQRPCGDSIVIITDVEALNSSLVCANLNAIGLDYVAKLKIPGINFNHWILKQLPIIAPSEYPAQAIIFISPRVFELTYTAWDLQPYAHDMGYTGPPFSWDEARRALLRAELDAYYTRLYGLNRKQLRYILDPADLTPIELEDILGHYEEVEDSLDAAKYAARCEASKFPSETFRVLKEKEIKKHGEYRTRRLVLEAWDRMQEAIDNGTEYIPMVDPPPAHPSVAHPMRDGSVYEGPGFVSVVETIDQQKSQTRQELKEVQPTAIKETFPSKPTKDGSIPIANSTQTSDYTLYKCEVCGQMVMGFDQENHTQQMHGGEEPGFVKL